MYNVATHIHAQDGCGTGAAKQTSWLTCGGYGYAVGGRGKGGFEKRNFRNPYIVTKLQQIQLTLRLGFGQKQTSY